MGADEGFKGDTPDRAAIILTTRKNEESGRDDVQTFAHPCFMLFYGAAKRF